MTQTRHRYAVMGATGHIGKVVTELLLQISNQVHGIGLLVRDANGDGKLEVHETFLAGLNQPFGMQLLGDWLYVANTDALVRFPYREGQRRSR